MGMEARTVRDVRALKVARDIFLFLFLLVPFSFYWGVLGWLGLVGCDDVSLLCLCGNVFGSLIFDWYRLSLSSSSLILVNG